MFLQNLCAIRWTNYLLDGVLALVLFGYVIYCAKRGFIDCFFGFFSTIIALVAAIFLGKVVLYATGGLFGLENALDKKFTEAFMKVKVLLTNPFIALTQYLQFVRLTHAVSKQSQNGKPFQIIMVAHFCISI